MREKLTGNDLLRIVDTQAIRDIYLSNGFEMVFDEDEQNVQIDIRGDDRSWFFFKLRDRSTDGCDWKQTRLSNWHHQREEDAFMKGRAVEQSRYWGDPEYPLTEKFDKEIAEYIINPFAELPYGDPWTKNMLTWLTKWQEVVSYHPDIPYPGQFSRKTVKGLARHINDQTLAVLKEKGYDYNTSIPTWLHVAQINRHFGFDFTYPEDKKQIEALERQLPDDPKLASWITVLQFWNELAEKIGMLPEEFITPEAVIRDDRLRIVTYPLTPQRNLWMEKKV